VVPPVVPIPGPVPPADPFPPPVPLDPINHVLFVVIASSSIPSSSMLVRSLSQKLVLTSPIITSTSPLSTLPASALLSGGQSISPGVLSGKPSRNVHQSSTHSPHSGSTSISHGHASHLTAPSSAPQSSPLHSIILSRNSTPSHLTVSHSTVPSLIPHSSARNNGVTSSSLYTLNAPHSDVSHSLTPRSSAGHSTAPHTRILPRNSTPHLTVSLSTALASVPHSRSRHISIILTNGHHSNNMLRSTASQSLTQSAVKSFNYPTSTRSLPGNNISKHRQTELPAPSTD